MICYSFFNMDILLNWIECMETLYTHKKVHIVSIYKVNTPCNQTPLLITNPPIVTTILILLIDEFIWLLSLYKFIS